MENKKEMKNERYFIVNFLHEESDNNAGLSMASTVICTNGEYVNYKKFRKGEYDRNGFTKVMILNIWELSESDYNDFIK